VAVYRKDRPKAGFVLIEQLLWRPGTSSRRRCGIALKFQGLKGLRPQLTPDFPLWDAGVLAVIVKLDETAGIWFNGGERFLSPGSVRAAYRFDAGEFLCRTLDRDRLKRRELREERCGKRAAGLRGLMGDLVSVVPRLHSLGVCRRRFVRRPGRVLLLAMLRYEFPTGGAPAFLMSLPGSTAGFGARCIQGRRAN
jgi:hypothetical protein